MTGGLYARVAARGFPVPAAQADTAAAVAQAALEAQGGTANPAHGQVTWGPPTSTLTGFSPEGPGPVQDAVLADIAGPGTLLDPNQTPGYGPGTFRSHAAPWPGWAGSYHDQDALAAMHEDSARIHGAYFGGRLLQDFAGGQSPGGDVLPMDPSGTESYGDSNQAPLSGPARVLGGLDAVQGYGGGGDGPGGVNAHGFSAVKANRLGITGNVINAYLDPAERPFMVPQGAGSFVPTDAVSGPGPHSAMLGADGVVYSDPSAYVPPAEPATLAAPLTPATAWGW